MKKVFTGWIPKFDASGGPPKPPTSGSNAKKDKNAHPITVGLRTQLCKECHDLQARLCEVDGKTCLFHRWIDEDEAALYIDVYVSVYEMQQLVRAFRDEGIVKPGCRLEKLRKTLALVEYPDGSVGKVDPSLVTFLDKEVK